MHIIQFSIKRNSYLVLIEIILFSPCQVGYSGNPENLVIKRTCNGKKNFQMAIKCQRKKIALHISILKPLTNKKMTRNDYDVNIFFEPLKSTASGIALYIVNGIKYFPFDHYLFLF